MPSFYKEIVYAYGYANEKTHEDFVSNIYSEFLWGNKYIYYGEGERKFPFIFKSWVESGITRIGDLKFNNGS